MTTTSKIAIGAAIGFASLFALPSQGFATTIQINSAAGLSPDGALNIAALGAENTLVAHNVVAPVTGVSGLTVRISNFPSAGSFLRLDQGSGWAGNFGAGEALLFTQTFAQTTVFTFNSAIMGFGVQVQPNVYGAFSFGLQAYSSSATVLGTFTFSGTSTALGDDSALFLGILSNAVDIAQVSIFELTTGTTPGFAFNGPIIQSGAAPSAVPEPSTLTLLALGMAAVTVASRARRA